MTLTQAEADALARARRTIELADSQNDMERPTNDQLADAYELFGNFERPGLAQPRRPAPTPARRGVKRTLEERLKVQPCSGWLPKLPKTWW